MTHRVEAHQAKYHNARGFTLTELLVVMAIIVGVSVVALPTIVTGWQERSAVSAASTIQAAFVGARDAAVHSGNPTGLRLVHDPALAGAISQVIQTTTPPDYAVGACSIYPGTDYSALTPLPCLVLEESPGHWHESGGKWALIPSEPSSWWWNVRVGEKVKIGGQAMTVCGPMFQSSDEGFTNVDPSKPAYTRVLVAPDGTTTAGPFPVQFLFLTNGKDDNGDGFIDNGWDGIDNDHNGTVDDTGEWELEAWTVNFGKTFLDNLYSIARRPVPMQSLASPLGAAVIDTARSRLPVSLLSGDVDLVIDQTGRVTPSLLYGTPSSVGLSSTFFHLWVGDRGDVGLSGVPKSPARLLTIFGRTGKVGIVDPGDSTVDPYQLAQQGTQ